MEVADYANLFKSLSEPVRLRILFLILERGELCVCELVDALELSQSVVSRHLAYLRNSGLVSTRREGVWVFYQVAETNAFVSALLANFKEDGSNSKALRYDMEKLRSVESPVCS